MLQRVGVRELANGLGQVALFLHDQAEPYHLHGLVGRKAERLFETLLRLRQFPELVIDKPQLVIGCGAKADLFARAIRHHLITLDSPCQIAVAKVIVRKSQEGAPTVGANGDRGANMDESLVGSALRVQKARQRLVCDVVVLGERQRALPE